MIRGPHNTAYEDGLLLFDVQFSPDYSRSPPNVHYINCISEQTNPYLYDGKICLSLLGTFSDNGVEVWNINSTLLQRIVPIQRKVKCTLSALMLPLTLGLVLLAEPCYEAEYQKQSGSQHGTENSKTYNEFVILKLVQVMTEMLKNPPHVFKHQMLLHFRKNSVNMCDQLLRYCSDTDPLKPEFTLLSMSKGLKLSLKMAIRSFQETLQMTLEE